MHMMSLENEKRLLLLLSSYYLRTNVTKNNVLDYIEDNHWMTFDQHDLETKHNRNELVWRNDLAFVRKHLAQDDLFISGIRNNWSITEKGIIELKSLANEALNEPNLRKITSNAINSINNLHF